MHVYAYKYGRSSSVYLQILRTKNSPWGRQMMICYAASVTFIFALISILAIADGRDNLINLPPEAHRFLGAGVPEVNASDVYDSVGTKWAVLIAGSSEYYNYRHQVISSFFVYLNHWAPKIISEAVRCVLLLQLLNHSTKFAKFLSYLLMLGNSIDIKLLNLPVILACMHP